MSGYLVAVDAAVAGVIEITSKSETSAVDGLKNLFNIKNSLKAFEGERGRLNERFA